MPFSFLWQVKKKAALSMMFSSDQACLESTHDLNEPFADTVFIVWYYTASLLTPNTLTLKIQ